MAEVIYKAELDGRQVKNELETLENKFEETGEKGNDAFDKVEGGASKSGVALTAVSGAVGGLIGLVIDLGVQAAQMFAQIIQGGVALNSELEVSQRVFTNLFGGDSDLGDATVSFLRETADLLRINQSEAVAFGQRILPRTTSLETFQELLRLTDIQADTTGKTIQELEFSIREALSGDFVSLRDQFDLSRDAVARIKELTEELGADVALVKVLGEEFKELGKEDISGTLQTDLKDLAAVFSNLQVELSEPIFDELKEQVGGFLEILRENGDELKLIAAQIGDILAGLLKFGGDALQSLTANVDVGKFQEFVSFVQDTIEAVKLFVGEILALGGTMLGLSGDISLVDEAFKFIVNVISRVDEAMVTLTQILGFARAGMEALRGVISPVVALVDGLAGALVSLFNRDFEGAQRQVTDAFKNIEDGLFDVDEAQRRARDSILETNERLKDYNDRLAENDERLEARKNATDDLTESQIASLNVQLELDKVQKDLASSEGELAKSEAELVSVTEDAAKRRAEIVIRQEEKRTEAMIKESQKRVQQELKDAQKLENIILKNAKKREDIEANLPESIKKANKKAADDRLKLVRDNAQNIKQMEIDLQRELQGIQNDFNKSFAEAERTNDAQAAVRALRTLDERREEAQADQEQGREDLKRDTVSRQQEIKAQLAQEIQDAKDTNVQKLLDLEDALVEEIEAFGRSLKQREEQEALAARFAEENQNRQFATELEKFDAKESAKILILQESLDQQLAIIAEFKKREAELEAKSNKKKVEATSMQMAKQAEEISRGGTDNIFGVNITPAPSTQQAPRFQKGGQFIVGGSGGPDSQLVQFFATPGEGVSITPPGGGKLPNSINFSPPEVLGEGGGSFSDNSRSFNLENVNMTEDMLNDPIALQKLVNVIRGEIATLVFEGR